MPLLALCLVAGVTGSRGAHGGPPPSSFVNWESAHVHPLDLSADGGTLAAVNTADNRLEVFRVSGASADSLRPLGSVPVGLEPVSVRLRTAEEAWVVNRISDSVSIVDLTTMTVAATIPTEDEPGDVVFAGDRAFVSIGTRNQVWVYDLPYDAAAGPTIVDIEGEDPRAMATDGQTVYALIFNAGNGTSVVHSAWVSDPAVNPYAGAPNPPPNAGASFVPPINPELLVDDDGDGEPDIRMPRSAMIVKMDSVGRWRDEHGAHWSEKPDWTLHRHALAHVDAASLAVTYTNRLMTINSAIDASPTDGSLAIVGTHAFNHIRFEPNLRGRVVSTGEALISSRGGGPFITDPNPHIAQFFPNPLGVGGVLGLPPVVELPPAEKMTTLGDPRGVAWAANGGSKLITGRGSNNLVVTSLGGHRLGLVEVGRGPTGVRPHPTAPRAYVLNRFDATISIVDLETLSVVGEQAFHDSTPEAIRRGRPIFYDTHRGSGLGQASCQSCHVDGGMDLLAWDLGDPSGSVKEFNQTCVDESPVCDLEDWHPMKGPMTTQSMQGLVDHAPFHWRGDREDLAAFNGAFDSLLATSELSGREMADFEAFVMSLRMPPNPNRQTNGELAPLLPGGGDPIHGRELFVEAGGGGPGGGDGPAKEGFDCISCHALPTGTNLQILEPSLMDGFTARHHIVKVPQLRDLYRKDGFGFDAVGAVSRGTGFMHDGAIDSVDRFLEIFFVMDPPDRRDVEAFLLSLSTDTHAGIGTQVTLGGTSGGSTATRDELVAIADGGEVGLVVHGAYEGRRRGFAYVGGGQLQSDRAEETVTLAQLDGASGPFTYMLVPPGSAVRIGLDRDEDGFYDADELLACADPADAASHPGDGSCCGDLDRSGDIGPADIVELFLGWGSCPACVADLDHDGEIGFADLIVILSSWGPCP